MASEKGKKDAANATRSSVRREMAKPRMARLAKIAEVNLNTSRISAPPTVTLPGTVEKIVSSPHPGQPEKAQITLDGADYSHRNLRFENILTDENGDDVKLKKGAHVEVTVTVEPKA
jgi:hypothetical protein